MHSVVVPKLNRARWKEARSDDYIVGSISAVFAWWRRVGIFALAQVARHSLTLSANRQGTPTILESGSAGSKWYFFNDIWLSRHRLSEILPAIPSM